MASKAMRNPRRRMVVVFLSAAVVFGPVSVMAHGWKAPAKAAERQNPVAANAASIEKGRALRLFLEDRKRKGRDARVWGQAHR